MRASAAQLEDVRVSARGLHWESLDEDISVEGLLRGLGDQSKHHEGAAA